MVVHSVEVLSSKDTHCSPILVVGGSASDLLVRPLSVLCHESLQPSTISGEVAAVRLHSVEDVIAQDAL